MRKVAIAPLTVAVPVMIEAMMGASMMVLVRRVVKRRAAKTDGGGGEGFGVLEAVSPLRRDSHVGDVDYGLLLALQGADDGVVRGPFLGLQIAHERKQRARG